MVMQRLEGVQYIPQLSDLLVVTCEYGLVDIEVVVIGHTSEF